MQNKKQRRGKKKSKNFVETKEIKEVINVEEKKEEVKQNQINENINENNKENKNENNNNDNNLDDIIKAFAYFDINHDGKINVSDLSNILSSFGETMTEEEMNNIFKSAGIQLESNEEIDYMKFIDFWIGNN